jgi:hypothetical protein
LRCGEAPRRKSLAFLDFSGFPRRKSWCQRRDLNPRPKAYESSALPLSYSGTTNLRYSCYTYSTAHKVAENLYRRETSGGYYALVKRASKQFRRSLRTKDRKLAKRRLSDLKGKIGALRISDDADLIEFLARSPGKSRVSRLPGSMSRIGRPNQGQLPE